VTTARRERLDDVRARQRAVALERGINPRDVDLLLSDVLGRSTSWIFAHGDELIDSSSLEPMLARRFEGEPLQYIRGCAEFYRREFLVDDRVLIPRPETELLVETALRLAPRHGRLIDIGTGSGCIAISIERERPDLHVFAIDRSIAALAVAMTNAARLTARVHLAASDLLSATLGRFDVIVSNPPYVPEAEYRELSVEVRIHEPQMALTPGPDGLEIIRRIFVESRERLTDKGTLIFEVGYGQERRVRDAAAELGFQIDAFLPDLAGIPRVVVSSPHAG
jgi:release factor glutamine methyltransferase